MRVTTVTVLGALAVACGGSAFTAAEPGDGNVGTETGSGSDGSTETGGGTADASCPSFCGGQPGQAAFCSDFDKEPSPTDWTTTIATNGGTVMLTQALEVSCPNALVVIVPQVATAAGSAAAKVTKDIPGGRTPHAIVALEVYLPSNDTKSYVTYFGVRPTAELATGVYFTHHGDTVWFLSSSTSPSIVGLSVPPLTGAWNAMTLDVTFGSGSAGAVTLTYMGADHANHVVSGGGTTANASVGGVTVEVGMLASGITEAAFTAYYDNVVVTLN
jgi:hypothetical protein